MRSSIDNLVANAKAARWRYLVVLSGNAGWCHSLVHELTDSTVNTFWVGGKNLHSEAIETSEVSQVLGREVGALVYDAHAGFDPDAFAALTGTLKGGGLMWLLVPPLDEWPSFADLVNQRIAVHPYDANEISGRFIERLVRFLRADPAVLTIEQGRDLRVPGRHSEIAGFETQFISGKTKDQVTALKAIRHVVKGHRRRPLVITADRGRGKSAVLGMAAAELLVEGAVQNIVVTAPRPSAVEVLFEHAAELLKDTLHVAKTNNATLETAHGRLFFVAPDELLARRHDADLVLVDEAAALPSPLLSQLVNQFSRVVFSTTVHGYEGSGRGFLLRFCPVLDAETPGWRAIRLEEPIRWAAGDPLEGFVFRSLALDAEPVTHVDNSDFRIEEISRDDLANDEDLLRQVFGLLVSAHYRTTPLDLRHLLDGPNIRLWIAMTKDGIVGTLMGALEGGFDETLSAAVVQGRRRPRGHLLPQTLGFHLGIGDALSLRGLRVIRIAVHPELRRRGIGHGLLEHLRRTASNEALDFFGASFAVTEPLLEFWRGVGMEAVRLGTHRETTSGAYPLAVFGAISHAGGEVLNQAAKRFSADFPLQLGNASKLIDPNLSLSILSQMSRGERYLVSGDLELLSDFALHQGSFESAQPAIIRLLLERCSDLGHWPKSQRREAIAVIVRVLQGRSWKDSTRLAGATGRRELIKLLRTAVARLLPGLVNG